MCGVRPDRDGDGAVAERRPQPRGPTAHGEILDHAAVGDLDVDVADAVVVFQPGDQPVAEFVDRESVRKQEGLLAHLLFQVRRHRVVALHVADLVRLGEGDRRDPPDGADDPRHLRVEFLRAGDGEDVGRHAVAGPPTDGRREPREHDGDDVEHDRVELEDPARRPADELAEQPDRVEVQRDDREAEQGRHAERDRLAGVPPEDERGDPRHPARGEDEREESAGVLRERRVVERGRLKERQGCHAATSANAASASRRPTTKRSSPAATDCDPRGVMRHAPSWRTARTTTA